MSWSFLRNKNDDRLTSDEEYDEEDEYLDEDDVDEDEEEYYDDEDEEEYYDDEDDDDEEEYEEEEEIEESSSKNIGRYAIIGRIVIGIIIVAVCVMGISFFKTYIDNKNLYNDADKKQSEYQSMMESALVDNDMDDNYNYVEIMSEEEFNKEYEKSGVLYGDYLRQQKGFKAHLNDPNMYSRINFSNLGKVDQSDVDGWLYVPDTNIDYVVMHGTPDDPHKYLWRDPYGRNSKTGSLFTEYYEGEDEDIHKVIYGHRLRDHSLYFGTLLSYRDEEYAKNHNYAYFYDYDKVVRYKLYCVNESFEDDAVYFHPYTRENNEYEFLLQDIRSHMSILVSDDKSYDYSGNMLVLSTCSGEMGGMPNRLYLVFEEDCYWKYE